MKTLSRMFISLVLVATSALAQSNGSPTIGKIIKMNGHAWSVDSQGRHEVTLSSVIRAGDRLVTDKGSTLQVMLGDKDSAFLLKPESDVKIEQVHDKDWQLQLESGGILSVVRNPLKRPLHYSLRTRTAVMGVRGTVFFVKSTPGQPVFFCDCQGTVALESPDKKSEMVFKSKHHDAPRLIGDNESGNLSSRITKLPPQYDIDHSDAEIAELKSLLGQ